MSKLYFAYGSNMLKSRLEDERIGSVVDHGIAALKDHVIVFNKQSKYGGGRANITPTARQNVLGVLYELSEEQFKTLDDIERGYVRIPMTVDVNGKDTPAQVYVALRERINDNLHPPAEYLGFIVQGAKDYNLPVEYQEFLRSFETRG